MIDLNHLGHNLKLIKDSDYMYYSQRLKILKNFYNRENIYYTEYFKNSYENLAKHNIETEMKEIEELLGET